MSENMSTRQAKFGDSKAIAERYGLSWRTVEKWTQQRRLPHIRISHRCVRYDFAECDEWFLSHHVPEGGSAS
jgi:hypothetical protein